MSILGIDYGEARIGLALADADAGLAQPLGAVANDDQLLLKLQDLILEHQVSRVVVGWPRGLSGQATAQTRRVAEFSDNLTRLLRLPVEKIDEALSSEEAKRRLGPKAAKKGAIDAEAAAIILQDYIDTHGPKA